MKELGKCCLLAPHTTNHEFTDIAGSVRRFFPLGGAPHFHSLLLCAAASPGIPVLCLPELNVHHLPQCIVAGGPETNPPGPNVLGLVREATDGWIWRSSEDRRDPKIGGGLGRPAAGPPLERDILKAIRLTTVPSLTPKYRKTSFLPLGLLPYVSPSWFVFVIHWKHGRKWRNSILV